MKRYKNLTVEGKMILKELRRLKIGYRLQIIYNLFSAGLFVTILIILFIHIYEVRVNKTNIPVWIFLIPIPLSISFSALKPIRLAEIALRIDKELGLKERLITSLYFLESKDSYAIPLFLNAINQTKGVKALSLFPLKWYRAALLLPLLTAVLFIYDSKSIDSSSVSKIPHQEKLVIQEEGRRIKEFADKLKKNPSLTDPWEKTLIQKLEYAGNSFQSEMMDKREAFMMLSEVSSLIEEHDLSKEKGDFKAQREYPETLLNSPLLKGEKGGLGHEVMDSIQHAKRHIAEAYTGAGKAGDPSSSLKAGTFSGDIISNGEIKSELSGKRTSLQGSVKKYTDSVIPFESVPKRYHTIIKRYFDAISKD